MARKRKPAAKAPKLGGAAYIERAGKRAAQAIMTKAEYEKISAAATGTHRSLSQFLTNSALTQAEIFFANSDKNAG